jgi:hypothetical protein
LIERCDAQSKVTSIAVLPVEGDPEMGARLATVLQQETTLRVESPSTVRAAVAETDSVRHKLMIMIAVPWPKK